MDRPTKEALDHAIAAATQADLTDTPMRGVALMALLNNLWPFTARVNQLAYSILSHYPAGALPFFLALKERKKDPAEIWPTFMAWLIENTPPYSPVRSDRQLVQDIPRLGKAQISYEPGDACRTYLQARIIQLAATRTDTTNGMENYHTASRELAEKLVEITRG